MSKIIKNAQEDFIKDEAWILSWNASVQRAHLYNTEYKSDTKIFNKNIKKEINDLINSSYINEECSEENHYTNIDHLVKFGSSIGVKILKDSYRYGVAQKLLNLYLKYLWCFDLIKTPPHCPIDRIILNKIKIECNWTQIDKESTYRNIIEKIKGIIDQNKDVLGSPSIAEWELKMYSRR